jgi:hypothetical protein
VIFFGISILYLLIILAIVVLFNYYFPNSSALINKINPFFLLVRWDSLDYLQIASQGYSNKGFLAFLPLYPIVINFFSLFFPLIFSGFLVSLSSLSVALYYLYKLLEPKEGKEFSIRTILLLLFSPFSIFFALIYTESLFLALSVAFFYYLTKRRWLVAAFIGFFAALTRNVGIFLWPVYLVFFLEFFLSQEMTVKGFLEKAFKILKRKEFWYSLMVPAGILGYFFFCYFKFGDFFGFFSAQQGWLEWRKFMWPWQTAIMFFRSIFIEPIWKSSLYNFFRIIVFEFGSFLILLSAAIYWIIKKNWPYAVFCSLNVLLFSTMFPMYSVNRFVIVFFPIFIFLAKIFSKISWSFYFLLVFFSLFFTFNVYLFTMGSWVG